MRIRLAYGRTGLWIELPEDAPVTVIVPQFVPGLSDERAAITAALRSPVGTSPLRDLVRLDDTVAVVFSDLTRPMPNDRVLPPLLDELALAGVPDVRIVLVNALGTHRPQTEAELMGMLGSQVVSRYRIVQHDAWDDEIQEYLAAVTFVDTQLGIVLDALYNGTNADDTIVVLWSDHGYHFGEKEHWMKHTLWKESTRVPLIIVPPGGLPSAQQCSRTVGLLDLYPTLIELCGLSPRPELEGHSLVPLLDDPEAEWDHPVVTTYNLHHSVRSDSWRYIRYSDGTEELYDHSTDPNEWTNLAGLPEYEPVTSELAAYLPT